MTAVEGSKAKWVDSTHEDRLLLSAWRLLSHAKGIDRDISRLIDLHDCSCPLLDGDLALTALKDWSGVKPKLVENLILRKATRTPKTRATSPVADTAMTQTRDSQPCYLGKELDGEKTSKPWDGSCGKL